MVDMVALLDGLSTVRLMDDTHKCGVRMFILYFCLGVYGYEERKESMYMWDRSASYKLQKAKGLSCMATLITSL